MFTSRRGNVAESLVGNEQDEREGTGALREHIADSKMSHGEYRDHAA
jgi:hypothetical protein